MRSSIVTFSLVTLTLVCLESDCSSQTERLDCSVRLGPAFTVLVPPPGVILSGGRLTRRGLSLSSGSEQTGVILEVFLDLMCWRSAEEWRVLKHLADHYRGDNVTVVINVVPLPYHRNSIIGLQGLLWYLSNKPDDTFVYVDTMFTEDIFRTFTNDATDEMNYFWIRRRLTDIAVGATNVTSEDFMYNIDQHFDSARATWKYSASRGVAGAPWYFINGVVLSAASETVVTYDMWIEYIDTLMSPRN